MSLDTLARFVHLLGMLRWFLATALELLILWSMRRARTIAQVCEWDLLLRLRATQSVAHLNGANLANSV